MLKKEQASIGEDVIVTKPSSPMHNQIGQIWKIKVNAGQYRISVSFEGNIYNFRLNELTLA